ncbi:MAG: DegT/DnrJ/EryC1/StrS family aminotransferase, partial [Candidatus Poseidoniales archaeon]
MRALGITENSNVVCPAFSYIATSGAIRRIGADINFVDTDETGNIADWGGFGLPDCVLYVNMYGNPADYDRLKRYCAQHKIPLVEDAAQSQGA